MRLVQFVHNGSKRTGVEISDNGDIVDVCAVDSSIPKDTRSFLEQGEKAIVAATRYIKYIIIIYWSFYNSLNKL